jgi:pyridoxal phosphate enzyme (YggS family)
MYDQISQQLKETNTQLVAVSKTKPNDKILELYQKGHRLFGENKVQELVEKHESLPKDIEWHFIGHLQRNKVKYIAPFIGLIHAVDSLRLLKEINKQAKRNDRVISCLLQFHIADEESKFGLDLEEARNMLGSEDFTTLENVRIVGVMGMATYTEEKDQIRREFEHLRSIFDLLKKDYFAEQLYFKEISMGMSGDYELAIASGSTMVRIGTLLFGNRNY